MNTNYPAGSIRVFNVATDPWIPVIHNGEEKLYSLTSTLTYAHEISGLGANVLPLERDSLLRLLAAATCMCVRAQKGKVTKDYKFDPETVQKFIDKYGDKWVLGDPVYPFMQNWAATSGAPVTQLDNTIGAPVRSLDIHEPGDSSYICHVALSDGDLSADPALITRTLVTYWYHSMPSNGSAEHDGIRLNDKNKRQKAQIGCSIGTSMKGFGGTFFWWVGPTLVETLLANIPIAWLQPEHEPVWLNQQAQPNPGSVAGSLWIATYAGNRPLIGWDENGKPVRYLSGASINTPGWAEKKSVATEEGAEARAAANRIGPLLAQDPTILSFEVEGKRKKEGTPSGPAVVTNMRITPDGTNLSISNYFDWHKNDLSKLALELTSTRALVPSIKNGFTLEIMASKWFGTMSSIAFTSITWISPDSKLLFPESLGGDGKVGVIQSINSLGVAKTRAEKELNTALTHIVMNDNKINATLIATAKVSFEKRIRTILEDIASQARQGDSLPPDEASLQELVARSAIQTFKEVSAPYRTPATIMIHAEQQGILERKLVTKPIAGRKVKNGQ